jgi:hypothetical protein
MRRRPEDDQLGWSHFVGPACAALFAAGVGVGVAAIPAASSVREPRITAVRARADAHVSSATRSANYGRVRRLAVDRQPLARSYLRFKVAGQRGQVRSINLLLYSHTSSRLGYQVRLVTRAWREARITFDNAPRVSSRFVSSGPVRKGAWKAVDVTSLVGELDEYVSLALTTVGTRAIVFASRESGLRGPRLVIERESPVSSGPGAGGQAPLKG